ncbi:ATP-dependent RNA helicase SrmB [Planctomycetes bacterium CA13]|uniref:ATP-dependent RNA helicase SrmB n=1 Tax=Novipirellula herctigrandis TaxID=2527986 RepID=A0A5C5Z3J0_9BACT|nr:ATP-dependent RNA helicase SrmB [Planctomycetes bacterium CA13]
MTTCLLELALPENSLPENSPPLQATQQMPALSGARFSPDALAGFSVGVHGALRAMLSVCDVQPRPYQQRIIESAVKMFGGTFVGRSGQVSPMASSVLVESPTGSGKTVMGLATAAMIQRVTGAKVGWVAMRRNLLAQAEAENHVRRFGVRMETISMFEKSPPKVDLLVVDEAQHDAATSMANLHSQIQPTWTLGLSATPYRSDRIKLCFDQVIRDAGIASLISDGYLSAYHHYTISEYSPKEVARRIIAEPDRWGRSLVFFHRRSECDLLYMLLRQAGITTEVVTANSNREQQIDNFVAGKTQVLVNMAILTEGFDCPELQTVFCRPSGKGCTIQMAGRVLRTSHRVPVKQVVQCPRTPHPMQRTAAAAEQYLWTEAGWRSIRTNCKLDKMAAVARNRVAQAEVSLPNLVAMNRNKRAARWFSRAQ